MSRLRFLHVGCGQKRKDRTTGCFAGPEWEEVRLDIDADAHPDIVGSMTEMSGVANASMDAIFSSHNLEHLYPHDVPVALEEFLRVLKPRGYLVVTCPDLQSVCAVVAQGRLMEPLYSSQAGPIAPLDIIYGHRPSLAAGKLFMAHRCGFTQEVLVKTLHAHGFACSIAMSRAHPYHELWAVAGKSLIEEAELRRLAKEHFPA